MELVVKLVAMVLGSGRRGNWLEDRFEEGRGLMNSGRVQDAL